MITLNLMLIAHLWCNEHIFQVYLVDSGSSKWKWAILVKEAEEEEEEAATANPLEDAKEEEAQWATPNEWEGAGAAARWVDGSSVGDVGGWTDCRETRKTRESINQKDEAKNMIYNNKTLTVTQVVMRFIQNLTFFRCVLASL